MSEVVDVSLGDGAPARLVLVDGRTIVDRRRPGAVATHGRRCGDLPRERRRIARGHLHLVPPHEAVADVDDLVTPSSVTSSSVTPSSVTPSSVTPSSVTPSSVVVPPTRTRLAAKRLLDVVLALILAIATLPVVALLLLGSLVAYRANPVFVQRRVGRHGREFVFVKVRSLPPTTPTSTDKYQLATIQNNSWGRLLRRFKLDELPQLWHVVLGRMSLVGPRPEMPDLCRTFDPTFVARRLAVRPGCSGLWQISPDNAKLIGEAPHWDLHYVERWTLRLDLWVLLVTVASIPGWTSVERLEDVPAWTGATARGDHRAIAPAAEPHRLQEPVHRTIAGAGR